MGSRFETRYDFNNDEGVDAYTPVASWLNKWVFKQTNKIYSMIEIIGDESAFYTNLPL